MRCSNCRVEIEPADFCPVCGAQLKRGAAASPTVRHEAPRTTVASPVPPPVSRRLQGPIATVAPSPPVLTVEAPAAVRIPPEARMRASAPDNNSGTGGPVPPEVLAMGYCWPGVFLKTFWLSAHNIPLNWQTRMGAGGVFTSLGTASWLGEHGYALAWQHRRFAGVREFQDTMKVWQTWATAVPWVVGIIIAARLLSGVVWVAINQPR